jgi:hypothetical protein
MGGEYIGLRLITLHGGCAHGTSPVPAETIFTVSPAIVENRVMVATTIELSTANGLNLAYELALTRASRQAPQVSARGNTTTVQANCRRTSFNSRFPGSPNPILAAGIRFGSGPAAPHLTQ